MTEINYAGYRFPPEIIHRSIWLYLRFTLSFRDVEDLLAERGISVSYETVRRWVNHFGPMTAANLRKRRPRPHTIWHLDEAYLKIDAEHKRPLVGDRPPDHAPRRIGRQPAHPQTDRRSLRLDEDDRRAGEDQLRGM